MFGTCSTSSVCGEGDEPLSPGKHSLEFDFKYDGLGFGTLAFDSMSGIGRGGTGVLKVMARSSPHRQWIVRFLSPCTVG
jgi:hypothetical protein